ncbi:MAG: FecR domain-containing protein [Deltaproteobacteria bacterium]|nr:FecR domain-containing protein [Deltaproteobacteria bacterium]
MPEPTPCQATARFIQTHPHAALALPQPYQTHVEGCATCRAIVAQASRLQALVDAAGHPAEPTARRRNPAWIWGPLVGFAAGAGVIVGLHLAGPPPGEAPPPAPTSAADLPQVPADRAPAPPEPGHRLAVAGCTVVAAGRAPAPCAPDRPLETGPGERLEVTLSDGSALTVNHSSRVLLRDDAPRSLRVEGGEALLAAAHRDELPALRVALPAGEVEVTGTRVDLYASPTLSVAGVLEGSIQASSAGQTRRIDSGGEALLVPGLAPVVKAAPDLAAAAAWAEHRDASLPDGPSGLGSLRARKPGARADSEQALRLADHSVDVRIQGAIARTTIEESFANETSATLEGTYTFPLPSGARIAALDLMVDGEWQRGAIVERERGDKIWRGVIRRATPKRKRVAHEEWIWVPGPWRDPALLQWKQGNQFSLRIFPIPPHGERRVRIAYTESLPSSPGGRRYVLPLAADPGGEARADRFRFEARVGGLLPEAEVRATPYALGARRDGDAVTLTASLDAFAPIGDIVLDIPDAAPTADLRTTAYRDPERDEAFALFALQPPLPPRTAAEPIDLVIVVDRSYSTQTLRLERAADLTAGIVRALGPRSRVQVLACGTSCEPLGEAMRPATAQLADTLAADIRALEAFGSTRLDEALAAAGRALSAGGGESARGRVVYLGDGIASVGELDPAHLAGLAREALGGARLTTVGLGGEVDDVVMRALARACGGAFVPMRPGDSLAAVVWRAVDRQLAEPLREARLVLPEGARDAAPAELGVVWPGEELLVAARLEGPVSGAVILSGRVAGQPFESRFTVDLRPEPSAGNAFVPRLWAERRIDELEQTDAEGQREAIVALSTRFHVLSRHTSLLVLESEAMARAFGVEATRPEVEWTGDEAAETTASEDEMAAPQVAMKPRPAAMEGAATKSADVLGGSGGFDRKGGVGGARTRPEARKRGPSEPARPTGHWVKVRRKAVREASFARPRDDSARDLEELSKREAALREQPESRERTERALRWKLRLGRLDEAETLARRWLDKDRLDAGALLALADVAILRGDFARALSWLESAVDLEPGNGEAHARMEAAWRARGERELACAHTLSMALMAPEDAELQTAAIRCGGARERHLAGLSGGERRKADKALERDEASPRVGGSLVATTSWDEGDDPVEVVIVTPKGRVLSRLGGESKLRADGTPAERSARVGTPLWELGRYQIRVVHAAPDGRRSRGKVRLVAYGQAQERRFDTDADADVAALDVSVRWEAETMRWETTRPPTR